MSARRGDVLGSVLADTDVWSLVLRRKFSSLNIEEQRHAEELRALIAAGRVRLLGSVRQEVLSGIRHPEQYELVRQRMRLFADEPLTTEDYEEAARMSNLCRRSGVSGSGVDFLICAAAHRRGWSILTKDGDFRHYARIVPVRLHGFGFNGNASG